MFDILESECYLPAPTPSGGTPTSQPTSFNTSQTRGDREGDLRLRLSQYILLIKNLIYLVIQTSARRPFFHRHGYARFVAGKCVVFV